MNDWLKSNLGSLVRVCVNSFAGAHALNPDVASKLESAVMVLFTVAWTVWDNRKNKPGPPPPPAVTVTLTSLLLCLATGCGTITTHDVAAAAQIAAYQGAKIEIHNDPGSRRYFVVGRDALRGLINSTNYSPVAFTDALHKLPVKELRSSDAAILIDVAVTLWEPYASRITALDQENKVKPVMEAVETGLTRALDETAP